MYEYKREPLTSSELERMVNSCETQREKLVVITLLDTGLREAELVGLRKDNVQWQQGSIIVWGKGTKEKGPKKRTVPMTKRVSELLQHHYLFNNSIGFSVKTLYRTVKRVAEKAMISKPVSPHVLRHTFAVKALQDGVDIGSLSKLLGHSDLRTTMIYLNISNEQAIDAFRRAWK